jgi:transcriptional regulator with XRE-family HTH domain
VNRLSSLRRWVSGTVRMGGVRLAGRGRDLTGSATAAGSSLTSADRAEVVDALEGDLDCLVNDAATRGISERSAGELLLTVAVLDWLRGGPVPGRGAIDFVEDRVALMNGAVHQGEQELKDAFRATLEELVRLQREAIAAGRWADREINREASLGHRLRRFGRKVDSTRRLRGLTIGELADRADMDVINVVAYILGAEEPLVSALEGLASALSVDPEQLMPPVSHSADGWPDDPLIGDLPGLDQAGTASDEAPAGGDER